MNVPVLLILALHLVVFAAIIAELGPRTVTLWRMRDVNDGYGVDRTRTWLKSAGMALVSGYEGLIWGDILLFGQTVLGPFPLRWHIDVAVWALLAVGSIQVARLYWMIEARRNQKE